MDKQTPSWELPPNTSGTGEVSEDNIEAANEWKEVMEPMVEPTPQEDESKEEETPAEISNIDNTLKMAGNTMTSLNPIFRELTEHGIDNIDSFVNAVMTCPLDGNANPYTEIAIAVGIDTKVEEDDAEVEGRAGKTNEIAYNLSDYRPNMMPKSHENDILSIRALRDVFYRVKNSEAFLKQRNDALAHGKSVYAELLLDKPVRDLPALLSTIGDQERDYLRSKAQSDSLDSGNEEMAKEVDQAENIAEDETSEE